MRPVGRYAPAVETRRGALERHVRAGRPFLVRADRVARRRVGTRRKEVKEMAFRTDDRLMGIARQIAQHVASMKKLPAELRDGTTSKMIEELLAKSDELARIDDQRD